MLPRGGRRNEEDDRYERRDCYTRGGGNDGCGGEGGRGSGNAYLAHPTRTSSRSRSPAPASRGEMTASRAAELARAAKKRRAMAAAEDLASSLARAARERRAATAVEVGAAFAPAAAAAIGRPSTEDVTSSAAVSAVSDFTRGSLDWGGGGGGVVAHPPATSAAATAGVLAADLSAPSRATLAAYGMDAEAAEPLQDAWPPASSEQDGAATAASPGAAPVAGGSSARRVAFSLTPLVQAGAEEAAYSRALTRVTESASTFTSAPWPLRKPVGGVSGFFGAPASSSAGSSAARAPHYDGAFDDIELDEDALTPGPGTRHGGSLVDEGDNDGGDNNEAGGGGTAAAEEGVEDEENDADAPVDEEGRAQLEHFVMDALTPGKPRPVAPLSASECSTR
jgi:hypothetical protein